MCFIAAFLHLRWAAWRWMIVDCDLFCCKLKIVLNDVIKPIKVQVLIGTFVECVE